MRAYKDLMSNLSIIFSPSFLDSLVLDPFVRSGTTLVATKEAGLEFVGIEIERKYIETIEKRIIAVTDQYHIPLHAQLRAF